MTPEQQRIAIAKACGYRDGELKPFWLAPPIGQPFIACGINQLPDYLNDLNAMHEAEKVLMTEPNLMNKYQNYELSKFVSSVNSNWLCRATSAQRAEAFLRTLNLWTP